MLILKETEFVGEVVWLGHVPAGETIRAKAVGKLGSRIFGGSWRKT